MCSGVLSAMSAMVNLEIPWINIMSKMDLVSGNSEDPAGGRNGIRTRRNIARFVLPPFCTYLIFPSAFGHLDVALRSRETREWYLDAQ